MPTKNPRLNITFNPQVAEILSQLAETEDKPVGSLAKELILEALEFREDLALSALATLRDIKKRKELNILMPGNKTYIIEYLEVVVTEDIPGLPTSAKKLIKKAIEERLTTNPISLGKPLRYSVKGHRRLRVTDYRVVYRIEDDVVLIVAIKHRKEVYEQ